MYRRVKGRGAGNDQPGGDSARAVSPIVGIILLFGMVAIAATVLAISGMALVDSLQSDAAEDQGVNELQQLDHTLRTQGYDDNDARSFVLSDELGEYEMNPDGRLSITARGLTSNATIVNTSLQTIELETGDGQTVAYQGGGIFMGDADGSSVRSDPALKYRTTFADGSQTKQLSFSVVDLQGDVGTGENVVNGQSRNQSRDQLDNIRFVTGAEIRIQNSTYHHGWNAFLSDEFGAGNVTHFESNRTVVVEAAIDHDRPFTQYVDIYPKIYGGLHTEAAGEMQLGNTDIVVDGYDSRNGDYDPSNASADLATFDTNDEVRLQSTVDIEGIPISNGSVRAQPGSDVTPFAFYADADTSPPSTDVLTAQLNESFEPVDPVTDKIENQALSILQKEGNTSLSLDSPGMYYRPSDAYVVDETLETGSGDGLHIGVAGDVTLEDVHVNGSGQVHIYATENITVSNVSTVDNQPSKLWVYGTDNASVTIEDTVTGVVYAPGSDSLAVKDGAEVYGSVVGGNPTFDGDATIHFDRSLRSALPLTEDDLEQEWSSTEPNELDVTFVLDTTGSMSESDPDNLTASATKNAIGMLESPHHRAGLFNFNMSGYTVHGISDDLESVNDSVKAWQSGGTRISLGIEEALDDYERIDSSGREKHMLLMTDGENSLWGGDERTLQEARRADEQNVTIWPIGFHEANQELMDDIANETGGESYEVTDPEDIEAVMEQILNEVIEEEEEIDLAVNLDFETNPRENHAAFDVQTFRFNVDSD